MAIKSPLRPETIAQGGRGITAQSFQNFITGNKPLGSSIFNTAANNIVGFQRGAARVAPQSSDLQSIIQTLSSNIISNVEGRVQTINQNVSNFITQRVSAIESQLKDKISSIELNTPNKLLEQFLKLYNSAIGYIQFFAKKDNITRLGNTLDELKGVFDETFQVATRIRLKIIKIVDQLNSLPTASAGGGPGINLDVDVPGSRLKNNVGNNLPNVRRPPRGRNPLLPLLLGAAGGAGSAAVVSALMDVGDQQNVTPIQTQTSQGITGLDNERFNSILDRFDKAIKNLLSGSEKRTRPSGNASTPRQQNQEQTSPSSSPIPPASELGSAKNLISGAESFMSVGFPMRGAAYLSGNVQQESTWSGQRKPWVLNDGAGTNKGLMSWNRGRITNAERFLGKPLNQASNEEQIRWVRYEMQTSYPEAYKIFMNPNATDAELRRASYIYLGYGDVGERYTYAQRALSALRQRGPNTQRNNQNRNLQSVILNQSTISNNQQIDTRTSPTVAPAQIRPSSTQSTNVRQISTTVAQPPPMQQKPVVNIMPVNMGQVAQQPSPPQVVSSVPPSKANNIPMIGSTNDDNFLTMYSKMVYNIVNA